MKVGEKRKLFLSLIDPLKDKLFVTDIFILLFIVIFSSVAVFWQLIVELELLVAT